MNKFKLVPKKLPGMRVIKTVLAVHICFLISFFRDTLPFYSAIAAILSMQNDPNDGWNIGKNRMIGTFIGGFYAVIAILLVNRINIQLFNYIHYLILSLFLIPVIYTNVHVKSQNSVYISCVVFLSITVAHGNDLYPISFALNRVFDTIIGIIVSLVVNKFL